jgi:hypothetical protein
LDDPFFPFFSWLSIASQGPPPMLRSHWKRTQRQFCKCPCAVSGMPCTGSPAMTRVTTRGSTDASPGGAPGAGGGLLASGTTERSTAPRLASSGGGSSGQAQKQQPRVQFEVLPTAAALPANATVTPFAQLLPSAPCASGGVPGCAGASGWHSGGRGPRSPLRDEAQRGRRRRRRTASPAVAAPRHASR